MKKFIALGLTFVFLLAACSGPRGPVRYTPPDTPGGRMCSMECRKAKDRCVDACVFKERSCTVDMQSQAMKSYEAYAEERFKAHQAVELLPSSFENPESCVALNCRMFCGETYNDCFENCGGKVSGANDPVWAGEE